MQARTDTLGMDISSHRPLLRRVIAVALSCAMVFMPTLASAAGMPRGVTAPSAAAGIIVKYRHAGVSTTADMMFAEKDLVVSRRLLSGGIVVDVPEGSDATALARELSSLPGVEYAEPDFPVEPQWEPNDPEYVKQWGYAHIQAPAAWDVTRGEPGVVIAVLDTGIDLDHADLAANIMAGGYDFGNGDADVSDHSGHGTHCAGIAAAVSDNATGVAGTAPGTAILPIKVFTDRQIGTTSMVADGIVYATDAGADVISMSLGGASTTAYLEQAIAYASSKGVVMVAAAGNQNSNRLLYPARSPGVIGVVATTDLDERATYSNYGKETDLAAPGTSIYSTIIDGFGYKTGTSMATPHVAGALALLRSIAPTATAGQLVAALQATAMDMDEEGWDELTGFGLIRIHDAMEHLKGPASWDATAPVTSADALGAYLHSATITLDPTDEDGSGVAFTRYRLDGAQVETGTVITTAAYGTHTLDYWSVDVAGNRERTKTLTFGVFDSLPPTVTRLYGATRYETCVALSEATFEGSTVATAVVASGEDFPDALSASSLAGAYGSPLLLTARHTLPEVVESELGRLGARHVLLIGGTAAVDADVEDALIASGVSVERIAGSDRYETAARVAYALRDRLGESLPEEAFVVRGDTFADALAVAPLSAGQGIPVLLTRPAALPAATADALSALGTRSVVIAGSSVAVSEAVLAAVDAMPGTSTPVRVWGDDRYATAAAVATYGVARGWAHSRYIGLGTGSNFPDALGGGVVAGANGGVLVLSRPDSLPAVTKEYIENQGESQVRVCIYGSSSAVSEAVFSAVLDIRF